MDKKSELSIHVNCLLELIGADGKVKEKRLIHNTVTNAGKYGLADQVLASPTLAKITHLAIGTGTPGANALGSELVRIIFDSLTRNNNVDTAAAYYGPGVGTGAITEAGTFDDDTAGNMWMSSSFSVINKGAADSLQVTWTLTIN